MAAESVIEWCDATFNPWVGCAKVSPACTHCYAEFSTPARTHRARGLELWGPKAARYVTSDANWREPLAWNRRAVREGRRLRVFCASLADVFEDHPALGLPRVRLWDLIERTPALDWLLLTKRPQSIRSMVPRAWLDAPRPHVWFGTTVEDQTRANERVLELVQVPAVLRFLSVEPLLEPVEIGLRGTLPHTVASRYTMVHERIGWVIVGGESGPRARPFDLAWARAIVAECAATQTACFVKQLGARPIDSACVDIVGADGHVHYVRPAGHRDLDEARRTPGVTLRPHDVGRLLRDRKGGDIDEFPEDLRVRAFPR
jgi:protein gp37